jgi:BlaI family penicillinase repressor
MEELTRTEEKVMQALWTLERGFVKDIIERLDEDPKPPYTTISSVVRILESKGFVGHTAYGKTYEYYPLVTKESYRHNPFRKLVNHYFDGQMENLLSFMSHEKKLTSEELESLKQWINRQNP